MSYLQFGGRSQNLKSSSLENLKVNSNLTVLTSSTLNECRFIKNFSFAEDTDIFDINAYRRFFELKRATESFGSSPVDTLDVSNLIIRSTFTSSGLAGEFTDLLIDNDIVYRSIDSNANLILFGDKNANYIDISGTANLAVGRNALRDFKGNNNIVLGSSITGTGTGISDVCGNNNIIVGNSNTLALNSADKCIILANNLTDANSNSIYLGSKDQTDLYTYSKINLYNGLELGLDVSSSVFTFNNMCDFGVANSSSGALSGTNAAGSLLQFYGTRNFIKLDSGSETNATTSWHWKIFLQDDDNVSKSVGINKALIFLSPSGRSYFLRDDTFNQTATQEGATGSLQISGQSFTGQHSVLLSENVSEDDVGKIVISKGIFNNFSAGVLVNQPNMNEALPVVDYTTVKNDKRCFGIISKSTKIDIINGVHTYNQGVWSSQIPSSLLANRCWVNSIGEGAILVTNSNGNFENGDFITTSMAPGYGMKQDDDLLHNYTVAKITEDMDFTDNSRVNEIVMSGVVRKVCLVGCTYHCG